MSVICERCFAQYGKTFESGWLGLKPEIRRKYEECYEGRHAKLRSCWRFCLGSLSLSWIPTGEWKTRVRFGASVMRLQPKAIFLTSRDCFWKSRATYYNYKYYYYYYYAMCIYNMSHPGLVIRCSGSIYVTAAISGTVVVGVFFSVLACIFICAWDSLYLKNP